MLFSRLKKLVLKIEEIDNWDAGYRMQDAREKEIKVFFLRKDFS